ncbi:MAG: hypothetical protein EOO58_01450 [Hymenobacter sp.]|nr:MAG: hypothetical protein EOO58_01450 [Hymenobacter sp.]
MKTLVGTFAIDESFYIIGRGLVLLGKLSGHAEQGYKLVFNDATCWDIKGVELNRQEKLAVLVDAPAATCDELVRRGIIWDIAQIFAP